MSTTLSSAPPARLDVAPDVPFIRIVRGLATAGLRLRATAHGSLLVELAPEEPAAAVPAGPDHRGQ